MTGRVNIAGLSIDDHLATLINDEVMPGLDLDSNTFWASFADFLQTYQPKNKALLAERDVIQHKVDRWHREHPGTDYDRGAYLAFLREIGYLVEVGEDFSISTQNVDAEIAVVSSPQLVVPVNNARYALNATNARWGSLYDALYGTDAIDEADGKERTKAFNAKRGAAVIAWGYAFLDKHVPLAAGKHADVTQYSVVDGALQPLLSEAAQLVGYSGKADQPDSIVLMHNGLHIELAFNRHHPIGKENPSGLKDIVLEAALTVIQDCEDSVTAVDGEDKAVVYRNWLGLMKGDLRVEFEKAGKTVERTLNPDRIYTTPQGGELQLPGRSVLFVRNVGHLMSNPAIRLANGEEVQEGLMDVVITALIAKHDIQSDRPNKNSRTGSMYVVKPKMHGPEEVAFAIETFEAAEKVVGLPAGSMKIGIMDEERRTTVNLKECIRQASDRVVFINTGFLDRTGDEIHTSMQAGAMLRKHEMKAAPWIGGYEDWNVDIGLACGFMGRAQIGKGMWAMPDQMHAMLEQKIGHPKSGADTAWVPSPTAAVLHATHYHDVLVDDYQQRFMQEGVRTTLNTLLSIPLAGADGWPPEDIQAEVDNNVQGMLGYVVRWVSMGIGCSKVPDIHDVGLMEDRATLRISSQLLANWLAHGIISKQQIEESFQRMAVVVDEQNADEAGYENLAPNFDSVSYRAALELVYNGLNVENGYTEPTLHAARLNHKAQQLKESR